MAVKCHACIGGTSVRDDMLKLENGIHVVVGTPGRVFDLIDRKKLDVNDIKMFVLDEADEMLSRGFKDQIYEIFKKLPPNVQVTVTETAVIERHTAFLITLVPQIFCTAIPGSFASILCQIDCYYYYATMTYGQHLINSWEYVVTKAWLIAGMLFLRIAGNFMISSLEVGACFP